MLPSNQKGLVAKCYFEKSWKCLEHDVRIEREDRRSLAIYFGSFLQSLELITDDLNALGILESPIRQIDHAALHQKYPIGIQKKY
jgi:hypothetical protein